MKLHYPVYRKLGFLIAIIICIVLLADILFYRQPIGWTMGLFSFIVSTMVFLRMKPEERKSWGWFIYVSTVIVSGTMLLDPGPFRLTLLIIGVITLSMGQRGKSQTLIGWVTRIINFILSAWTWILIDLGGLHRISKRYNRSTIVTIIQKWTLPVALSLIFIGMFAVANPVIEKWVEHLGTWGERFFSKFGLEQILRILFWTVIGVVMWALLRPRNMSRTAQVPFNQPQHTSEIISVPMIVRCLVLFNLIFALQTIIDITYLAGGATLPEGMTYKQYARRGAYPLVGTALLAGIFVLITFRSGMPQEHKKRMKLARQLVYLWLAQNLLLLVSAIWRLHLYIEANHLTRLRVAAAIWMGLLLVGFILIIIRIITDRNNRWLVTANAAFTGVILLLCSFVNFDGFIAQYNVNVYTSGANEKHWIDIDYLEHLGPAALPALYNLSQYNPDLSDPREIKYVNWMRIRGADITTKHIYALKRESDNWRRWTWEHQLLKQFVNTQYKDYNTTRGMVISR